MTNHFISRKMNIFVLFLMALVFVLYLGCEKEKEVLVPKENHETFSLVIIVAGSAVDLDSLTQGTTVDLTVDVSTLPQQSNLTIDWSATGGTFSAETGDTVSWKAPDNAGAYTITAHADGGGTNVYKGTRNIGVGLYAPDITPYFVGGSRCAACHSPTDDEWEETAHAHAWATLQESGHPASYCNPCHTVDTEQTAGNSGYDDAPIALYENVQCENCHGPGSAHVSGSSAAEFGIDFSAANCGACHEGPHHPYVTEWTESPHHFTAGAEHAYGAVTNGGCEGCHEGVAAAERLSDEAGLATFFGGAPYGTPARGDTLEFPLQPIVCSTCHDPHSDDNPGQLRTVADVQLVTANGESPIITVGGTGKLCMQCHHARRGPESHIASGDEHFGPHANPQADMMAGKSGYHGVADVSFEWADPSHLNVQNSCKTCHLNMEEYVSEEEPTKTGHTFEPTVEACANCHGTIASFDDIMALEDFDNDGTIEGIQSEVEGLMEELEDALIAAGLDTSDGVDILTAVGDTTRSTVLMREAGWNLAFIEDDKSHGIHNPDYAIQLLLLSYEHLTGSPLSKAAVMNRKIDAVGDF